MRWPWLKIGAFAQKGEKKIIIKELERIDPANDVAKKAQKAEYAKKIFHSIQDDPAQTEQYIRMVTEEMEKVVS